MARESRPSGELVYPKLEVPKARQSEPRLARGPGKRGRGAVPWLVAVLLAAAGGAVAGYLIKPSHAAEASKAKAALAGAQQAADAATTRADALAKDLDAARDAETAAKKQVETLSSKAEDAEKKAAELAAEQKKLQGAIDGGNGSVSTEGEEIHLKLVDKVLFPVGEDQLSDRGKAVLDKVAAALRELPDKQVWVQGHTDDQPIVVHHKKTPAAKGKAAKGKAAKGKAEAEDDRDPGPILPITNWELSAARALSVVHYLQDVGKIAPTRLAALAFGQYRPVSRTNRALNRRIEIVLYPQHAVIERAPRGTAAATPAKHPRPKRHH